MACALFIKRSHMLPQTVTQLEGDECPQPHSQGRGIGFWSLLRAPRGSSQFDSCPQPQHTYTYCAPNTSYATARNIAACVVSFGFYSSAYTRLKCIVYIYDRT